MLPAKPVLQPLPSIASILGDPQKCTPADDYYSYDQYYQGPMINIAYQPQTIYINQWQAFPPSPYPPHPQYPVHPTSYSTSAGQPLQPYNTTDMPCTYPLTHLDFADTPIEKKWRSTPGKAPKTPKKPRQDGICSHCSTSTTTLWRKNDDGNLECNACNLYYRRNHVKRPLTLCKETLSTRNRRKHNTSRFAVRNVSSSSHDLINTRPVDENAQCERRPSKAPSHSGHAHPHDGSAHVLRLSLSLILFYLLVSIFPAILFYPVSLLSMAVPHPMAHSLHCSHRNSPQIAAIVVYISLFPLKDYSRKPGRGPQKTEAEMKHYRTVFYIILATVEFFILIVGICLKWQLVTLHQREQIQKRRSTLVANRPLIDGEPGAGGPRRSLQKYAEYFEYLDNGTQVITDPSKPLKIGSSEFFWTGHYQPTFGLPIVCQVHNPSEEWNLGDVVFNNGTPPSGLQFGCPPNALCSGLRCKTWDGFSADSALYLMMAFFLSGFLILGCLLCHATSCKSDTLQIFVKPVLEVHELKIMKHSEIDDHVCDNDLLSQY
ncbi:unnamed protein product [Caenorhabditis sp. 36 PRJEB53466]|nr:unnamed protein product [Caenorhabditis sp. 36 PRJEB53466]